MSGSSSSAHTSRQPEIQQLYSRRFRHQNVRRLQIAMRDAFAMRLIQRLADLVGIL